MNYLVSPFVLIMVDEMQVACHSLTSQHNVTKFEIKKE